MTLIQLKYFQTICKYNNITRASAELHVSQPSLSNAVKELEREFGVSLFTRRSRGLELTPEGRYFLDEADKLLEQAEQLTTNMKHMSTTDRTLTLGLPAMSGSLVFTDLLRTLYARSPSTHIQVMENGSLANRSKIMDSGCGHYHPKRTAPSGHRPCGAASCQHLPVSVRHASPG